jgi:hypothetical protein
MYGEKDTKIANTYSEIFFMEICEIKKISLLYFTTLPTVWPIDLIENLVSYLQLQFLYVKSVLEMPINLTYR